MIETILLIVAVGILSIGVVFDWYGDQLPMDLRVAIGDVDLEDPRKPDEIRAAYTRGQISVQEMERRLLVALDEDRQSLRASVETVSGIGPDTSWNVAERMYCEEQLVEADLDELKSIPNVGEKRAQMLKDRLS